MLGKTTSLIIVVAALGGSRVVAADPYADGYNEGPSDYSYSWYDNRLPTGIGVGLQVGGGVSGFTDSTMRNTLQNNVAGLWDARLSIGTHVPLGIDVSYVGTAGSLNTANGANNATLIGTAVEGALRWNILPHFAWDPYVFAGAGWQNYELSGMTIGTVNGIRTSDNTIEFPMGVGMSFRDDSGWLVDLRGTFRWEPDSKLIFEPTNGGFASAHQWAATGSLGYEF